VRGEEVVEPASDELTELTGRVRTAHGDAWQAEGRLRAPYGGGATELPGIRLMSSGITVPQWNNGDVVDPSLVDIDAVRSWFSERGVPWGVRVPAEAPWPHGRHLFRKRCMALLQERGGRALQVPGLTVRRAEPDDLEVFAAVDAEAFGEDDPGPTRDWTGPHIGADGFLSVLAELEGEAVGVATGVLADGRAGTTVGVFGVGVLPTARRRGVGGALTGTVVDWGFSGGADLAWLCPDSDEAVRLYARMGFVETGGFDIYVDL
jgi:ribosomal protein S18 acetylase RimI-like enzyme